MRIAEAQLAPAGLGSEGITPLLHLLGRDAC